MLIFNKLDKIKKIKSSVIAIGNFDGLHLGHQKVLNQARLKAKKNKSFFGVVTFEPVPVMFFNKKIKNHRINSLNQKINSFKNLKINFLVIIKFNKKFSKMNYKNFIYKIIHQKLNSKFIFISKNFRFGKNREGDVSKLINNESTYSYKTCVEKPLKKYDKVLSSSTIREEISKGNIEKVNRLLGRKWCIEGNVIKGEKRGRKIGFPTCNIKLNDYALPKLGVYAVKIEVNKMSRMGIANIGYRPTFKGKNLLLEVNIFGLKANLYNKKIKVNFIKFIRSEKKFNNIDQLKVQIKKDIIKVKNL
jgi:riboflavin kinase/FMN adenylyltransferase